MTQRWLKSQPSNSVRSPRTIRGLAQDCAQKHTRAYRPPTLGHTKRVLQVLKIVRATVADVNRPSVRLKLTAGEQQRADAVGQGNCRLMMREWVFVRVRL